MKKGTSGGGKSGVVHYHLLDLYNKAAKGRSPADHEAIVLLLQKYYDAFSKNDTGLGMTNMVRHYIDTGDAKPIK